MGSGEWFCGTGLVRNSVRERVEGELSRGVCHLYCNPFNVSKLGYLPKKDDYLA